MEMRLLTPSQVHAETVAALGLDSTVLDLSSPEALAAALRRAAGFLCPCPANTLIRAVTQALYRLLEDDGDLRDMVEGMLEALVAHGDLFESRDVTPEKSLDGGVLIYTATPSFVYRESGDVLLLGVIPDQVSPLPNNIQKHIEYENHVRRIPAGVTSDLKSYLSHLGLIELSYNAWLKAPPDEHAVHHFDRLERMLDKAPPSGDIPGLTLLDPASSVRYYKGRWFEPGNRSGHFVSRRPQTYGADLWCYVEVDGGQPQKLLDLPISGSRFRGCDEAWGLQSAIDAMGGHPQQFQVSPGPNSTHIVKFFSPVPMWANRRWDSIGQRAIPDRCLFSYRFPDREIEEELNFARQKLWLVDASETGKK
jgi:hypothetical protein